ncbi:DNA helicase RecQ [Priestia taiwanensis]|uniref:DNA helicase RecQ n=1 Tax=Priestia taiwanensis TaxID=1347902 RepID=A0A917ALH3_9BACI|nr:DNA helicase RecQ [Priestia taiwanensis]MBM7362242.1 ATP-dependent DNA helicase RecQ [Priestia taiwanensis]GGE60570.1 ATP-dependent DNA helicase RecQ [Priestia taiwanensis]
MFAKAQEMLQAYFGYESFRLGQEKTVSNVLSGNNTMCIMPTGGGKSICYQVPALVMEGTTLVISPLISLMKDQVDALEQVGVAATYINSSISGKEAYERMKGAKEGRYKLLYVAPERLDSIEFLEQIKDMHIPLIAVDEAHCISQWGHDFRPSYLHIHEVINSLPQQPIVLALTATATPQVQEDICRSLHIELDNTVMTSFERTNLAFSVIKGQDSNAYLFDYIHKNKNEAGIVYTATRKVADQLCDHLQKENIRVAKYHAGMSNAERMEQQDRFLNDEVEVMVATSAFGMGIDKSNIRYVIHYQLPKNMESYYQEAGRAGRDGLDSQCVLLYRSQDVQVQRFLVEQSANEGRFTSELEKLQQMVDYCHTEQCLQAYILHYFGEEHTESCGRCANCTDERTSMDVTKEAQMVLSCVIRTGQRFGKTMIAQVLTGSKNKKVLDFRFHELTTYGILSHKSVKEVNDFIEFLISEEYIRVEHGQFPTILVTPLGRDVLLGNILVQRKEALHIKQIVKDNPLFEELRHLRKEIADEENVPPFVIFSDQTLQDMCVRLPKTVNELLSVKGIGERKKEKYGERFVQVIHAFCEDNPTFQAESVEVPVKKERAKATNNSHLATYDLYKGGKTIQEIAVERGLSPYTIENHLVKCSEEGLEVDWLALVPKEYEVLIGQAAEKTGYGKEGLKAIKELLPEEITYTMIKAYLFAHRK